MRNGDGSSATAHISEKDDQLEALLGRPLMPKKAGRKPKKNK